MKVLLTANHTNIDALAAMCQAQEWLAGVGVDTEAVSSGKLLMDDPTFVELHAAASSFDLVCAFGGDGTILRAARLIADAEVPLMGFNFGSLGFLASASADSIADALEAHLAGETVLERRVMLEAKATFSDGGTRAVKALNEVAIGRSELGSSLRLCVSVNGNRLYDIHGDGVIVATATGSTAYSLAAGGPLLAPGHRGLCLVPISAHPVPMPAIVTAPEDHIEIKALHTPGQVAVMHVDGQRLWDMGAWPAAGGRSDGDGATAAAASVAALEIHRSPHELTLVRYETEDYYSRLSDMLRGGKHDR
jgi:NAD+ kinase